MYVQNHNFDSQSSQLTSTDNLSDREDQSSHTHDQYYTEQAVQVFSEGRLLPAHLLTDFSQRDGGGVVLRIEMGHHTQIAGEVANIKLTCLAESPHRGHGLQLASYRMPTYSTCTHRHTHTCANTTSNGCPTKYYRKCIYVL